MFLEYCSYNKHITNYSKELGDIFSALDYGVDGLAIPIHFLMRIKEIVPKETMISVPIDYPLGYSSSKSKINSVLHAVKVGANAVDYVPNSYYLKQDFSKLKEEIETCVGICKDYNATFRMFLDHNRSDLKDLITIVKIYNRIGVDSCFPSIGYHHDEYVDNIINAKIIEEKTDMPMMFNGYICTREQFEELQRYNFFGIRLYNMKFLV